MAQGLLSEKGSGPYIGVLIAVVAVSFASIFTIWSDAPPMVIAAYRMLFATLILLPVALGPARKQFQDLSRYTVFIMVGIGVVLALHFITWNTSLTMTTVAASTLLVTAHPLIIGLVSVFYLKETDKKAIIGMSLGFAGIVLISLNGFAEGQLGGDILAFMGCLFAAVYIIGGRVMRQKVDIIPYAFMVYLFATLFLFSSCMATSTALWPMSMENILLFLLLAAVSTIFGHTMYNWSLKYVSASFVSISLLGEPIIASILAMFIFGQVPSPIIIISGLMLLVGVVIVAKYEVQFTNKVSSG